MNMAVSVHPFSLCILKQRHLESVKMRHWISKCPVYSVLWQNGPDFKEPWLYYHVAILKAFCTLHFRFRCFLSFIFQWL